MENGLFITQLIGLGLVFYTVLRLGQLWLSEPNPWDVMAEQNAERHERRQALADYASTPIDPGYQPTLRIRAAFLRDIGAEALANSWLAEILNAPSLEEQLLAA